MQRVPENFHHVHKSKGVSVPTDIDDGKPGAYDLPPPSTAGALAPTAPPKDKDGNPLSNGANGYIDPEDYDRWVERTGWAPRYGSGDNAEELAEEENIADHQTWVEGKLDDKFFGGEFLALVWFGRAPN